jgi:hypothetical protein
MNTITENTRGWSVMTVHILLFGDNTYAFIEIEPKLLKYLRFIYLFFEFFGVVGHP